jgi:CheY-like chemotaxis protein
MPAILLVEDDPDNRETLAGVVAIMRYKIITAVSGEELCRRARRRLTSTKQSRRSDSSRV